MKKISSILITLLLILTTVFALSSCMVDLSDILNPLGGTLNGGESDLNGTGSTDGDKTGESGAGTGGTSGGLDSSDSSAPSDTTEIPDDTANGKPSEPESSIEFLPSDGNYEDISGPFGSMLSIVSIVSTFESAYGSASGSVGSGVIYKIDKEAGDAYIITNFHVLYNRYAITEGGISDNINLYLYGMELEPYKMKAEYVGGSLTQDLAVIKVEGSEVIKNSYARAADIGSSDKVCIMDEVIVAGNPEGMGISVTTGIISVDSETLNMIGADAKTQLSLRVIRIDAPVNEGNSGGGLFDENGKLIGIVNAKRTGSDVDNIAYAIPISYAKNFVDNIIHYCDGTENRTPSKCLLGVTVTNAVIGLVPDEDKGTLVRSELVEVSELTETSVLLGKLEVGDRLLSVTVDGVKKEITRVHNLIDHILTARVGSTVTIEATRDGEVFSVTVTVPESSLTTVK